MPREDVADSEWRDLCRKKNEGLRGLHHLACPLQEIKTGATKTETTHRVAGYLKALREKHIYMFVGAGHIWEN